MSAVRKIIERLKIDVKKKPSKRLGVGGLVNRPEGAIASRVQMAFKAPVAMTLLPFFAHAVPKVMFLHVLRDGRDIAFSHNQVSVFSFLFCLNMY